MDYPYRSDKRSFEQAYWTAFFILCAEYFGVDYEKDEESKVGPKLSMLK
jgi:hypothetical protein